MGHFWEGTIKGRGLQRYRRRVGQLLQDHQKRAQGIRSGTGRILVSRKLFKDFLNTRPEDLDEIQRAVRFYYIIRTSFGGKGEHFGYAKTGKSNLITSGLYEAISAVYNRLRRVYIEEGSFEDVIDRYDGQETVFYLDPPYYETCGYRYTMDIGDYERLAELLRSIQGRFLLTINDHERMREVFKGFDIEEVEVGYSIGKKTGRYGELIVKNYR